ncbi:hypothetical protein KCTC52924_00143 [Arenibacter antarcticus]|uniref:DUF5996 family protein n=1 Tax=Arenibacter antarcticus TaxID=2040469 RepID=A0ABW5VN85_9FLAO|nr:DUF5996 family protein [Arenibacter sp. H213]MCM4169091.1 hypothetical protein [Arenibacter sp. H213]
MTLPYLPYNSWKDTRITIHLILQIIGKIRLAIMPRKNHWWYVTEYVSIAGFSTHPIPMNDGLNTFEITLNVHKKMVQFKNSKGEYREILLQDGYSVGQFYTDSMAILKGWGVTPKFINKPLDMGVEKPFDEISEFHHYDWASIHTFWQMMLWNDGVLKEFSGLFYGKTCPVHIYWHHMDLTVTRFSGKLAPPMDVNARILEKDAYSHEVISFGFWAGDDNMPEPAYYSYTFPAPPKLKKEPLKPKSAFWMDANGSPMAMLKFGDIINSKDPRNEVLNFLESAYQAGAKCAQWEVEDYKVPPLNAF